MLHSIQFKIDTAALVSLTDEYIAQLWHIGQANPAEFGDREAGELAESIGREIIRRWVSAAPIALHTHQGRDYAAAMVIKEAGKDFSAEIGECDAFVTVPETTLPGGLVVPAFQVGQFATSRNADGQLTINGSDMPWVNITFAEAGSAAAAAGCKLITETQWLAIAWNVSQVDSNWSGSAVGAGKLNQGIRDDTCARHGDYPQPERSATDTVRRYLTLSNGQRVYDVNGNVFQWVFDDVQGDATGIVSKTITERSLSRSVALAAGAAEWRAKGLGWQPTGDAHCSGRALIRGGCFYSEGNAGVFGLGYGSPDGRDDLVGFRCTK